MSPHIKVMQAAASGDLDRKKNFWDFERNWIKQQQSSVEFWREKSEPQIDCLKWHSLEVLDEPDSVLRCRVFVSSTSEKCYHVWTWNHADVLPSGISSEIISLHKVTFSVHLRVIKRNKLPNRRNMLLASSTSYSRCYCLCHQRKLTKNTSFIDKMLLNGSFMVETRSFSFFKWFHESNLIYLRIKVEQLGNNAHKI